MKTIVRLFVFGLVVVGWALAALSLHVVRTPGAPKEFVVVPKNRLHYIDTYVDTRAWTLDDVSNHPAVAQRLIDTGKTSALSHVVGSTDTFEVQEKLTEAIQRGPRPVTQPEAKPEDDKPRAPQARR
jgi:hypothetical protein